MLLGTCTDETTQVCNLANTASLLYHAYKSLPSPSSSVNWAGFYVLDPSTSGPSPTVRNTSAAAPSSPTPATNGHNPTSPKRQLILGPFLGKVACQTIAFGRGVCGTVAASGETAVVKDVEEWPGHIACDGDSRSEVVVPIFRHSSDGEEGEKEVVGVIDVDCAEVAGFDEVDRVWLEKLAELLGRSCDW